MVETQNKAQVQMQAQMKAVQLAQQQQKIQRQKEKAENDRLADDLDKMMENETLLNDLNHLENLEKKKLDEQRSKYTPKQPTEQGAGASKPEQIADTKPSDDKEEGSSGLGTVVVIAALGAIAVGGYLYLK